MKFFYSFLLVLAVSTTQGQFISKEKLPEFKPWEKAQWLPPGERRVHIKADNISLADLFTTIWKQVHMHPFFILPVLDPSIMIKADFIDTPLDSVLTCILSSRGLIWKYYDLCYVITEREESDNKSTAPPGINQWTPPGQRKISLKADSVHLADIFRSIGEQAGIYAVYKVPMLDPDTAIRASFNNVPLDTVLASTSGKRGFRWKYDDNAFYIIPPKTTGGMPDEGLTKLPVPSTQSAAASKNKTMAVGSGRSAVNVRDIREKIWLRQPHLSEVRSFEQKIGSSLEFEDTGMPSDFYPFKKKYPISLTPLVAERWEVKNHLPVCAHYYYTPGDSIVRLITYDWLRYYESVYADDQEQELMEEEKRILREEDGQIKFYKSEFERVKGLSIRKFGPPTLAATNELRWDKPRFHATLKLIFKPYMHYIRFKVYWK